MFKLVLHYVNIAHPHCTCLHIMVVNQEDICTCTNIPANSSTLKFFIKFTNLASFYDFRNVASSCQMIDSICKKQNFKVLNN